MTVQKLTQVTVQGLATNPNPNALPAGSCAVLNNATMRKPGVIAPMATFATVVDTTVANGRKILFDEVTNKNVLVYSAFDGLTGGKLQSFSLTGGSYALDTIVTQLPKTASTARNLAFLPGQTQGVTSHFRHMITEQSGVVVNQQRWAGLPPPFAFTFTVTSDTDGFLVDTQSVAYRSNFTLESTDDTKPYIVNGPVGAISAVTNDLGAIARVTVKFMFPVNEPFATPTGTALYLNIYRSTQAVVDTVFPGLAEDFRLICKFKITDITDTGTHSFEDRVSDEGRDAGEPLYTNNIGQFGEQASNYPPPSARDICVFKDTVFYANRAALSTLALTVPGAFGELQSNKDRLYGIGSRPFVTASTTGLSTVITFTDADELLGVVPGQRISIPTALMSGVVVSVNVGAKTVTGSTAALFTTGPTAAGTFYDRLTFTVNYTNTSPATTTVDAVLGSANLNSVPGFRILHPAIEEDRTVDGVTLTAIYTWPAYSQITNFYAYMTNGQNYSPTFTGNFVTRTSPLISIGDLRPNRLFFSRTGEPEAVPLANYIDVGAGTIVKMWANQSALLVCCSDGLWKVTGDGTDFTPYQLDPTARLVHPDCLTSLNNVAYGWITDGFAKITEDGATTISTDAIGPAIRALYKAIGGSPIYTWGYSLAGDSLKNELWFSVTDVNDEVIDRAASFLYNDDSKNFSTFNPLSQYGVYDFAMYSPVIGQMVFVNTTSGPSSSVLLSPSDSYSAGGVVSATYLPLTVWFNPLQTEDKGNLKQFVDLNYFTANYSPTAVANTTDWLKATFNARGEGSDLTSTDVNVRNLDEISRDVHYMVPRRTALSDQQQIGLVTYAVTAGLSTEIACYVEIQGFTVRYRIASPTLKR